MRRSSLDHLLCSRCRSGPLRAEGEGEWLRFGPVHCRSCGAVHPLADGILDLSRGEGESLRSPAQWLMERNFVARAYERVRPFLADLDPESEHLLLRSLLAPAAGSTVLDLSCGAGLHLCRLARDTAADLRVFGLDRSGPMLTEAAHHLTEAGATADLIRGEANELPFRDGSLDAILDVASFHLYGDPAGVLRQVARALRPGGTLVCATLLSGSRRGLERLEARSGIHRHDEPTLRSLCESAGLGHFERIRSFPWILFRVRR